MILENKPIVIENQTVKKKKKKNADKLLLKCKNKFNLLLLNIFSVTAQVTAHVIITWNVFKNNLSRLLFVPEIEKYVVSQLIKEYLKNIFTGFITHHFIRFYPYLCTNIFLNMSEVMYLLI